MRLGEREGRDRRPARHGHPGAARGGSQAFVADLARGLIDRGHDVHLYAASGSQITGVDVIDTGVDHRALGPPSTEPSAPRAGRRG